MSTCCYCNREMMPFQLLGKRPHPLSITDEHLIPRSRGGTNRSQNIKYCCYQCNQEKGGLTPCEYLYMLKHLRSADGLRNAKIQNLEKIVEEIKSNPLRYAQSVFERNRIGYNKEPAGKTIVPVGSYAHVDVNINVIGKIELPKEPKRSK